MLDEEHDGHDSARRIISLVFTFSLFFFYFLRNMFIYWLLLHFCSDSSSSFCPPRGVEGGKPVISLPPPFKQAFCLVFISAALHFKRSSAVAAGHKNANHMFRTTRFSVCFVIDVCPRPWPLPRTSPFLQTTSGCEFTEQSFHSELSSMLLLFLFCLHKISQCANLSCYRNVESMFNVSVDNTKCVFVCLLSAAEPGGLCGLRQSPQPGVPEVGEKRLRVHVNGCR